MRNYTDIRISVPVLSCAQESADGYGRQYPDGCFRCIEGEKTFIH